MYMVRALLLWGRESWEVRGTQGKVRGGRASGLYTDGVQSQLCSTS